MIRRSIAVLYACVLAGLPAGCADRVPDIQLAPHVEKPSPGAVVFFIDGFDIEVFRELQQAGQLPNLTRHFVDSGVRVERAAASLPTITYANSVSLVTGQFPGHHGITGNKWFDRDSLVFQDYTFIKTYQQVDGDFGAPTLYEMLHDEFTATITVPVRRGATRPIDNWMSVGVSWFFDMNETVNQLSVVRLELLSDLANRAGRWPRLILTYFPASDTVAHKHGPDTEIFRRTLIDIDRCVGQFLEALQRAGLYETTYRVLVTDHGFVSTPPDRHLYVERFLEEALGMRTRSRRFGHGLAYEKRLAHFQPARAVVVSGGNRRCSLHLRVSPSWHVRPTAEQIDSFARDWADRGALSPALAEQVEAMSFPQMLAALPAVDLVGVREGPGAVRVLDRRGVGRITRRETPEGKLYRYEVLDGEDPLDQAAHASSAALMDGRFHGSRQWLAASADAPRPDVVPQMVEMFDSPRTGDVILFARDGWAFTNTDRGGHGGLLAHEILVPFYVAGPDLAGGASIPYGRTVDLTPTLLGLLGRPERFRTLGPPDGIDLSPALRAARPSAER